MMPAAQRWRIGGRVQGVGFRPFVYRLARDFELTGWVRNSSGAVEIHAEGSADDLRAFGAALLERPPAAARARLIEVRAAALESDEGFRILSSTAGAEPQVTLPVDLATCDDCLAEMRDPAARRHRYPFNNCTQCGPRYTIIRRLPYDRCNTTLDGFALCEACAAEYADVLERRFHAQPIACAACGPSLRWRSGATRSNGGAALAAAVADLARGGIVAVRGIGGYHLLCDAASESAVRRLRDRKGRPSQPFAVMMAATGADGLDTVRRAAHLSALEAAALIDRARPIVLVVRRHDSGLAESVAPGLRTVGLMLPYSPLHHLLLEDFGAPLVVTSGNVSGEPVLTLPEEAEQRLGFVADGFLHHDRPIARPADDSVVRLVAGAVRPLRLGRGHAPVELHLTTPIDVPTLAVGAHSKGTVGLAWGDRFIMSAHIGTYDSPRGRALLERTAAELQMLHGVRAERVVHDAHPGFASTAWALGCGLPNERVWHHHAHASAAAGEFPADAPLLCFTWDGVGLGPDGTLWGGEALLGRPGGWRRVASFRPFRLPGGERAARQPWRCALALCWECGMTWSDGERRGGTLLRQAFDAGLNAPVTTSVGRLFDAAAALTGTCPTASHEGEGPMRLESLCTATAARAAALRLPLNRDTAGVWRCDWAPLVPELLDATVAVAERSATLHLSLAQVVRQQACAVREESGVTRVALTGGVFQNTVLTGRAAALLGECGFEVLIPRRLPLNDAAISFGQLVESAAVHSRVAA